MKKLSLLLSFMLLALAMSATTIYDIQYTTESNGDSPLVDQEVTITGIVTAAGYYSSGNENRFFMCDLPEVGTGAWHGIYVYNYDAIVAVGDEVTVTAKVVEYYGFTELSGTADDPITVTINSSGNEVPAPVDITTDEINSEMYEGVLCRVLNVEVVDEIVDYGQWYIDDGSGECQVDDGFFDLEEAGITVTEGDTWGAITGVVDYSYDEFGLTPRSAEDMVSEVTNDIVPQSASLLGNYPNPFNPTTEIQFNLEKEATVSIEIYNILGQKVKDLKNDHFGMGTHSVIWNGDNDNNQPVTSGVYFYRMKAGKYTSTKKMILLK